MNILNTISNKPSSSRYKAHHVSFRCPNRLGSHGRDLNAQIWVFVLISLALISSDFHLTDSPLQWSTRSSHMCLMNMILSVICFVCRLLHVCVCMYICKFASVCGLCVHVRACSHDTDTVTSPSVMVLIVQMVKLAAPTKQQTIYSNTHTNANTQTHTHALTHTHTQADYSTHQPPAGFVDRDWTCTCMLVW